MIELHCSRKFTDISSDENRFLLAVLGLTKIVNPVIKNQFKTLCSKEMFNQIRADIYEEQLSQQNCKGTGKDAKNSLRKRIYLTADQKQRLFSPNGEFINVYTEFLSSLSDIVCDSFPLFVVSINDTITEFYYVICFHKKPRGYERTAFVQVFMVNMDKLHVS